MGDALQGRLVEPILPIPAVILTSWLGPFTQLWPLDEDTVVHPGTVH